MLRASLLASLLLLPAFEAAQAAERCKAKVDKATGAIVVSAVGVGDNVRWGTQAGNEVYEFSNVAACVTAGKAKGCMLGEAGTSRSTTPPEHCTIFVADDTASCAAHVAACTPGTRAPAPKLVFHDDFEDGIDSGWDQVYGSTQTISATGDCGEAYWSEYANCGSLGLTFDERERWDYQTPAMTPGSFSLYFHDNASDNDAAAWMGVLSPGDQERLGVETSICPNTYYISLNAGEHRCTTIPRRQGWHKVEFVRTGSITKGYLDHVLMFETNRPGRESFDVLSIMQEVAGRELSGFAIDDVRFEAY